MARAGPDHFCARNVRARAYTHTAMVLCVTGIHIYFKIPCLCEGVCVYGEREREYVVKVRVFVIECVYVCMNMHTFWKRSKICRQRFMSDGGLMCKTLF